MLGKLFGGLFSRKPVLVKDGATVEEGESRGVDLGDPHAGGVRIILCKVDGAVHALDARCPHAGGQIQTGPLEQGRFAVCPLHRYLFDPKTGKAEGVACRPAKRFRTRAAGDDLEVFL
jgi:nitrite reductase/ring-hydroxylating ferredoxin subunit